MGCFGSFDIRSRRPGNPAMLDHCVMWLWGARWSPWTSSPDPEPPPGFLSCFSDVVDGSAPCRSCDAQQVKALWSDCPWNLCNLRLVPSSYYSNWWSSLKIRCSSRKARLAGIRTNAVCVSVFAESVPENQAQKLQSIFGFNTLQVFLFLNKAACMHRW